MQSIKNKIKHCKETPYVLLPNDAIIFFTFYDFLKYSRNRSFMFNGHFYEIYLFSTDRTRAEEKMMEAAFDSDPENKCFHVMQDEIVFRGFKNIQDVSFNPFVYINEDNPERDIMKMSRAILSPFFKKSDIESKSMRQHCPVLNAIIAYFYFYTAPRLRTFRSVKDFFVFYNNNESDINEKTHVDLLFENVKEKASSDSFALRQYNTYKMYPLNKRRSIAANVCAFLSEFDISKTDKMTETNTLPLEEILYSESSIVKPKKVLVADIDKETYPCLNSVFLHVVNSELEKRIDLERKNKNEKN